MDEELIEARNKIAERAAERVTIEPVISVRFKLTRCHRLPCPGHPHHDDHFATGIIARAPLSTRHAKKPSQETRVERSAIVVVEFNVKRAAERRGSFYSRCTRNRNDIRVKAHEPREH